MKNSDWINKQATYDFLCFINEEDSNHCVVTRCEAQIDEGRCYKYNTCEYMRNRKCTQLSKESSCEKTCNCFKRDCRKCIADYLKEERRFVK